MATEPLGPRLSAQSCGEPGCTLASGGGGGSPRPPGGLGRLRSCPQSALRARVWGAGPAPAGDPHSEGARGRAARVSHRQERGAEARLQWLEECRPPEMRPSGGLRWKQSEWPWLQVASEPDAVSPRKGRHPSSPGTGPLPTDQPVPHSPASTVAAGPVSQRVLRPHGVGQTRSPPGSLLWGGASPITRTLESWMRLVGVDIPEVGEAAPCSSHIEGGGPVRRTSGPLLCPCQLRLRQPPHPWGATPLPGVAWTLAQLAEAWGPGGSPESPTHRSNSRPPLWLLLLSWPRSA